MVEQESRNSMSKLHLMANSNICFLRMTFYDQTESCGGRNCTYNLFTAFVSALWRNTLCMYRMCQGLIDIQIGNLRGRTFIISEFDKRHSRYCAIVEETRAAGVKTASQLEANGGQTEQSQFKHVVYLIDFLTQKDRKGALCAIRSRELARACRTSAIQRGTTKENVSARLRSP